MCEKIRNDCKVLAVKLQAQRSVEVRAGVLEDNIKVMTEEVSLSGWSISLNLVVISRTSRSSGGNTASYFGGTVPASNLIQKPVM